MLIAPKIRLWAIVFSVALIYTELQAQNEPLSDMFVNSSLKPFNSRSKGIFNLWEPIDHSCNYDRSSSVMRDIGTRYPKYSQSHLEALAVSNVRFICVNLSPIEQPFINSPAMVAEKNKAGTVSCLTGIVANQLYLRQREVNYYADVVDNIHYWERFEDRTHNILGMPYRYKIIRKKSDVDSVLQNPYLIGVLFTIEGGHSVGHSIYINENITNEPEYKNLVNENILRLKGNMPLSANTDQYLDIPIVFFSPCKFFQNGMGGQALGLTKTQQDIYTRPMGLDEKPSQMGKDLIDSLLARSGRRILIDVSNMGQEYRLHCYKSIERAGILGEDIPLIASHCGISGKSSKEAFYKKKDDDAKNNNSYLNHWHRNLSKEDILNIYNSKGIIGITLDKTVLAGQLALTEIENAQPGTSQKRKACLKLLMANILTVVQTIDDAKAWDMIAIGSNFDGMFEPLDVYTSAEELPRLADDIQLFLEHPEAIADVFSVDEIQRLTFDLKSSDITRRIMSTNLINFVRNNLDDTDVRTFRKRSNN